MGHRVALLADLMLGSRVVHAAAECGVEVVWVRSGEALREAAARDGVRAVVVDMETAAADGGVVIRSVVQERPEVTVVAVVPHVRGDLAKAAREAGAARVVARSALVGDVAGMLGVLAGSARVPADRTRSGA